LQPILKIPVEDVVVSSFLCIQIAHQLAIFFTVSKCNNTSSDSFMMLETVDSDIISKIIANSLGDWISSHPT
jgi:hypothetical protein